MVTRSNILIHLTFSMKYNYVFLNLSATQFLIFFLLSDIQFLIFFLFNLMHKTVQDKCDVYKVFLFYLFLNLALVILYAL